MHLPYNKKMKKVLLKIDGMTCSACSSGLEKFLNKQQGIKNASVNLIMNNASIEYDEKMLDIKSIEKLIQKAGFESLGIDNFKQEEKKKSNEKYKLAVLTVLSILILYISMSHMVNLPVIPFLDMMKHQVEYSISLLVLSLIVLFIGKDILKNGYKNLIHKTPNMDTLVTIGVATCFLYSLYGTIRIINGNLEYVENLYYESAAIVIFFIKIGKYIENKNKDKTKEALKELMSITPNKAIVLKEGKECIVTIDEIQKGDIVLCKPGEKIAVDGTIVDGTTHINESFITGESVPVKREINSKVIAGSINYEGTVKYKAEKIGKKSTVSEIVRLVVEATNTKAPISKIADKISGYFVPTIIIIAIISFIIWFIISKDFAFSIKILVDVLVVACPCSLGLATPLAIVIASGNASKAGILIKTSEALENAHKVKTIVFDKTGTLTYGKLKISKIYNYSNLEEKELIQLIGSIEAKSTHPIGKAFTDYMKEKNISELGVKNIENIAGYGLSGEIAQEKLTLGNRKLIEKLNIENNYINDETKLAEQGNSIVYVSKSNKIIALIGVNDIVRENAQEVIKNMNKNNIKTIMLTGDNEETANKIGKELGITKVISNVLPAQKADMVKQLKTDGNNVMMCGDGINDSPALTNADIGVSVKSGTDIAMDSADVILTKNDLNSILTLINISEKTVKNIKQNLFWAFFYNILMIPVAIGILRPIGITLNPMIASLAMVFSSLTVILNALRLKQ